MRVPEPCLCGDPACARCFPLNQEYSPEVCEGCGLEHYESELTMTKNSAGNYAGVFCNRCLPTCTFCGDRRTNDLPVDWVHPGPRAQEAYGVPLDHPECYHDHPSNPEFCPVDERCPGDDT